MSEQMSNSPVIPQWRSQGPNSALTAAQPHLVTRLSFIKEWWAAGHKFQALGMTCSQFDHGLSSKSLPVSAAVRSSDAEGLSPLALAAAVLGRGLKYATLIFASLLDLCTWFQKASIKGLRVLSEID